MADRNPPAPSESLHDRVAPSRWPSSGQAQRAASNELATDPCSATKRERPKHNTTAAKNLKRLLQDITSQGFPLRSVPDAVDMVEVAPAQWLGNLPAMTCTRAGRRGCCMTVTVGGMLTTREMLHLQGLPEHLGPQTWRASQIGSCGR